MTLADILPPGRCRILRAADEEVDLKSRLYALGIFPGVELSVLRVAPFGDPIQIKVGTALHSIRKRDAVFIEVQST